jgi:hypothetical protein
MRCLSVGWLGEETPPDEIFDIPRHRPASISRRILELPSRLACDMVLVAMTRPDSKVFSRQTPETACRASRRGYRARGSPPCRRTQAQHRVRVRPRVSAAVLQLTSSDRPGSAKNGNESEADAGTRTPDPIITSDVLYQLSYVGVCLSIGQAGRF